MNKKATRFLACLMALVMLLAAAPVSVFAAGKEAPIYVLPQKEHKHQQSTVIQAATLSEDGAVVTVCTVCKKTLSKKTIAKIKTVKLEKDRFNYTGKAITPAVVVKDRKGKTLRNGKDYSVSFLNNKNPGKATAKVTFKGNYSGTKSLSFSILPKFNADLLNESGKKTFDMKLSWNKVSGAFSYKLSLYNGKKLIKTVKTSKTEASFSKLPADTKVRLAFTAYNLFGKEIVSGDAEFKTPKLPSATKPQTVAKNAKEAAALYNSAVNALKKEKNVTVRKVVKPELECTSCSVPTLVNTCNRIVKSFLETTDETVKFKNGKGKRSASETITPNSFISPCGKAAKLSPDSIQSASIAKTTSGGKAITIKLKKEQASFSNGKTVKTASGNSGVLEIPEFSALDLGSIKIDSYKTVYPGTTLKATLNKNGKLTKLTILASFESSITSSMPDNGVRVTIGLKGCENETYTIKY